jgi:FixJ family two-component response regulator
MQAVQVAHAELQRLTTREREIFEALIGMGVKEDDPDLNQVHKTLLKWYKLDMRQREIERELAALG